jgi:hypothetical protein
MLPDQQGARKSERQFPAHIDRHEKTKSKLEFMTEIGFHFMELDPAPNVAAGGWVHAKGRSRYAGAMGSAVGCRSIAPSVRIYR